MRIAGDRDRTAAFLLHNCRIHGRRGPPTFSSNALPLPARSVIWSVVSTAWMESMKGRTSGSSAINPNTAASNIVRGLTEPDTALRRSKTTTPP
jgi:hypothetical protein